MTSDELLKKLDTIISRTVAPNALEVDKQGTFPDAAMKELAEAGILGAMSAKEVGGAGLGLKTAAQVVRKLGAACGSTAMVTCMHYCGTAVYEALDAQEIRRAIAQGKHLTTLAFSEAGSRSHFWAPMSTAKVSGHKVTLNAHKSWVTSAHHVDSYVWSSRSENEEGVSLWSVPRNSAGLDIGEAFDGLGFRGNDSVPIKAKSLELSIEQRLGEDGSGFGSMMQVVLPHFSVLNAACSLGLMDRTIEQAKAHISKTGYSHQDTRLCDFPTLRAYLARCHIRLDQCAALWERTIDAIESQDPATMLYVLECKASAGDAAIEVTNTGMRICGGAAFRKELGIERSFRDAQAAAVMAPTSDVLYDFIGKALCDMPLF